MGIRRTSRRAREAARRAVLGRLREQRLVDVHVTLREAVGAAGEHEPPDAVDGLVREPEGLVPVRIEPLEPAPESQHVVLAQALDVA